MANNSKAELLNWLSADGRLLGNDMVFAIDKAKADALLTQEYIRRFNTSSYLPPINGETAADNGYKVYMQNFVLDHPRLSFDNVDITSSKASLRMKIVAGHQVDLKQAGAHWYPQRIDAVDPLVGPELSLKLDLSEVPGSVDDDGRILLDLRNSDDFVLTFSESNRVRQLGGDFFKELFRALPVEQRVWSLGQVERGRDELFQPERFSLRTQRDPSTVFMPAMGVDQPDVEGAVLGMVRMLGNDGQQTVIPGPDYRYLIPADSARYSATVLFGRHRVFLAALFRQLGVAELEGAEFKIEASDNGFTATALAGNFVSAGDGKLCYQEFYPLPGSGKNHVVSAYLATQEFRVPVKGTRGRFEDLKIIVDGDHVTLSMESVFSVRYTVVEVYENSGLVNPRDFEGVYSANYILVINVRWKVSDAMQPILDLVSHEIHFDNMGGFEGPLLNEQLSCVEAVHSSAAVAQNINSALMYGGHGLVTSVLLPALREKLVKDLTAAIHLNGVIDETIRLNFGEHIAARDYHLPNDAACFGHVSPVSTTFTVTPLESIITQGSSQHFITLPAQSNLSWSVEAIEGSSGDAGKIDSKGLYQAPKASDIQGEFTRVRITATHLPTAYKASALISVVKNALSLSPLVEVCQVDDTGVSLKAGHVGEGELQWRILGASPNGRLAHATGSSNTYIPGSNVTGKAFVVEQVEVRNSHTNEQRTLCVITAMTQIRPSDVLVTKQDTALGRVWLELSAGSGSGISELAVLHGPGQIGVGSDGKPYYQAVSASPEPFCVVRAVWDALPGIFSFEGFIILPLPLGKHTAVYERLGQATQRIARTH